jgi:hypothetical protein
MAYFRRRRWDVDVLLIGHGDSTKTAQDFHRLNPWARSVRQLDAPLKEYSLRGMLFRQQRIATSASFRKLARERHDLFMADHVSVAPLLEVQDRGRLKVLEAQDITPGTPAVHHRTGQPQQEPMAPTRDAFLWKIEQELYRLFDAVIFGNAEDACLVQPVCPGRVHTVPPMVTMNDSPAPRRRMEPAPESLAAEPFDMIVTGTGAEPDVVGLRFFYREIFVPYLRKHRLRMAVAGGVAQHLDADDYYVTRLTAMPHDVDQLIERSKLVIIPVFEGSGIWRRTVAHLACGRAIATSPAGTRGLASGSEAFVELDMQRDPHGAAQAILELLASEPNRLRMRQVARDYCRTHFAPERYFTAMDEVMASLGIPAPIAADEAAISVPGDAQARLLAAASHSEF